MDSNVAPRISVIMAVFNAENFVLEAIKSILSQTFLDFEFIIINDGSTDKSEEFILSFSDYRILYIKNAENQGLVTSLNIGLDLAQGEYIARMDADDISLPDRFAKQIEFLDKHQDVGVCGTAYKFFGDSERIERSQSDYGRAFTYLSISSSVGHPTAMIRKEVLEQHGIRYEKKYSYAADYAFWINISKYSYITSLQEPLLLYRWHSANMSKIGADIISSNAMARALWYETLLGTALTDIEQKYLLGERSQIILRGGESLLMKTINVTTCKIFDISYFGELNITDWELKVIDQYGLIGLIRCFLKIKFRRYSRATYIGLVAHYLYRKGIKIKPW